MDDNPLSSANPQAQLVPSMEPVATPVSEMAQVVAQPHDEAPVSAPASAPAMDEPAKMDFLWHTHQYLGEYSRFGDTKAAFAGTLTGAILGGLYSARAHVRLLQTSWDQWPVSAWLIATGSLFLVGSIALAVWTILPRLRSSQSKGFIYWGSIAAHGSMELLQTSFHAQSAQTLNDHLLHHVFDISTKVCIPKYRAVYLSITALFIGGFLGAAGLLLQDRPHNVHPISPSPNAALTAPPCKNGEANCDPWKRDWGSLDLKPGSLVTKDGPLILSGYFIRIPR
jgi:hypothetical protein